MGRRARGTLWKVSRVPIVIEPAAKSDIRVLAITIPTEAKILQSGSRMN